MFGNLGFGEMMIIMVIVLVLFGAKRIPEVSASFGKGIREFKKSVSDVDRAVREPERDNRFDRDYNADRIQNAAREAQPTEERPEPKRLLS